MPDIDLKHFGLSIANRAIPIPKPTENKIVKYAIVAKELTTTASSPVSLRVGSATPATPMSKLLSVVE